MLYLAQIYYADLDFMKMVNANKAIIEQPCF